MKNEGNIREVFLERIEKEVLPLWNKQKQSPFSREDWADCLLRPYSEETKRKNEELVTGLRKRMRGNQLEFEAFLKEEEILYVEDYMGKELFDAYLKNMCRFLRASRSFDGELTMGELWQALRNYLIYGMICAMMGAKQNYHEAIMAYSLLYPYTDNYIDNPENSKEAKETFNKMIYEALLNKPVQCKDQVAEKTRDCIKKCLAYQNESKVEETSLLLRVMLDAQKLSTCFSSITKEELAERYEELFACQAYKGGLSVVLDYYFMTEDMKESDIIFFLKFGLILQLADDIQDIEEDMEAGNPTYYTTAIDQAQRDERFYKLLHFVRSVFEDFDGPEKKIQSFMLRNCELMLLFACIRSNAYFSKELIREMEDYFPFHYDYLEKMKEEIGKDKETKDNRLKAVDLFCDRILKE